MKKQKVFILIASLVISYSSLEAAFQQETLIAKLGAKGQSIHIQELANKQEAERQKQSNAERAEKQRIAKQEEHKTDRLKKQEIEEQRKLIQKLEVDEDHFMTDSIPVSEER
ncbi:hypothetical protein RHABOEDO_000299 [Candidatus Rhabdochlamydia oedothoracis]|uniref:Uncharacterized protein n=1 Tax=Candidatus Rhabdochlamydia oedothoracis TaxID=2720720 RepID=A0ABX8V575_9BACT|nr:MULTISPECIES: hypothetical protein [Rhabdochlamydia]KAG6559623.1 hypothetical protein RHOW815_000339 [Candidatus Rhabdochlamydia sp. W815]MCL6756455.1 hypothetical protein [Candidatus Rhabdochlamydia oedothoracis]QYF48188.1 hypothetical protein RHABOEDO_000299 [Candidatus Rhabdochlamydia oedothoracis]